MKGGLYCRGLIIMLVILEGRGHRINYIVEGKL